MATNFFQLNTGGKMPLIGLGTWQSPPELVAKAVDYAVRVGYRHMDCAYLYGNEKQIGEALKKLFEEGVVKREDMWITSKLWGEDHAPEDVPVAFERSLKDLQLDYLDLYLIHSPIRLKRGAPADAPADFVVPTDIPSTWRAMEALFDSGRVRAIGVSNFSTKKLGDLLGIARVPPAVNQVECHPAWQQPKLREFCESKGVHLSAWSPLGRPGTYDQENVLGHPVVTGIAERLGRTPAQIALRWGLQAGHGVLPKSSNEERISENFDIFGWSIPDDLMAKFSEIKQEKLVKGERFVTATGPYKTVEELWDGEV